MSSSRVSQPLSLSGQTETDSALPQTYNSPEPYINTLQNMSTEWIMKYGAQYQELQDMIQDDTNSAVKRDAPPPVEGAKVSVNKAKKTKS